MRVEVDINIIVATRLYTFDEIPHFFHYRGPGTILDGPELMTEMFVNDIRHGIGGTEVRAAFFKGVVEERGLTADQARVQAPICEAHQETRVPITVHTSAAHQTGRLALDFYERLGVYLTKVVVGHAGDSNDLDYLKWIMDQGTTIGCDRLDLDMFNPTADRVRTIARRAALTGSCSATTRPATAGSTAKATRPPCCPGGTTPASSMTCCPRCANTASTRPRSRRCWSTTPPATSPEARSEPNGSYRDSPHAQPLPASGCSG